MLEHFDQAIANRSESRRNGGIDDSPFGFDANFTARQARIGFQLHVGRHVQRNNGFIGGMYA